MPTLSPQDLLRTLGFGFGVQRARLLIVTGEKGAGKTSWCAGLRDAALRQSLACDGLLSLAEIRDGVKVGIRLHAVGMGENRPLAVARAVEDWQSFTPRWQFHEDVLAWGNDYLASVATCDILFIDELGPLELTHGKGWQNAFDLLARGAYRLAVVVVRPSLVGAMRARYPHAEAIDLP
jgi:nucleoside-triphosphatase THEP1